MFESEILQEFLRTDACPPRKKALEMVLAQMNIAGNLLQLRLSRVVRLEKRDGAFDTLEIECFLG
jgi:hypothetical protein